jgi:hypothetical protein
MVGNRRWVLVRMSTRESDINSGCILIYDDRVWTSGIGVLRAGRNLHKCWANRDIGTRVPTYVPNKMVSIFKPTKRRAFDPDHHLLILYSSIAPNHARGCILFLASSPHPAPLHPLSFQPSHPPIGLKPSNPLEIQH